MKYITLTLLLIGSNVFAAEFTKARPDILLTNINLNKNIKEYKNEKTYNEIHALLSKKEEEKLEWQTLEEERQEKVKQLYKKLYEIHTTPNRTIIDQRLRML